jgi:hypothetical protein
MTRKSGRSHSPAFKTKVALVALKDEATLSSIQWSRRSESTAATTTGAPRSDFDLGSL